MPTFTTIRNYVKNQTLTQAMLDAAFTSIETFLDTTKLDAANIQSGAITAVLLAAGAVGTAALASNAVTSAILSSDASVDGNRAVGTNHIQNSAVTTAKIAAAAITAATLASSLNLPGKTVQENGNNLVVSNTNAGTNSLAIIRGSGHWSGTVMIIDSGEGFTLARTGVGFYTITFSSAFLDAPVCIITCGGNTGFCFETSISTTAVNITLQNGSGTNTDSGGGFQFLIAGQRA